MKLDIYQVDAFATRPFEGNPAAVCPLDKWLPDELMQSIAMENNLSETAFFVAEEDGYRIRWFTPVAEVDLCGHATLASAWVLFNCLGLEADTVIFLSRSGRLPVRRRGDELELDFPAQPPRACAVPDGIAQAIGAEPQECREFVDLLAIFDDPAAVREARPDMAALAVLDYRGIIITAPGEEHDFISRFFGPAVGVPEDPVTGSAHTKLTPYWAGKLGKNRLRARQVSPRGGDLLCTLEGDRVRITGRAVLFLRGSLEV